MGARFLFIGTLSLCLVPGSDGAQAQTASSDSEVLPAIEVTAPATSARPAARPARGRTAPSDRHPERAPGSCLPDRADADRRYGNRCRQGAGERSTRSVPRRSRAPNSLNIADALQQHVPGLIISDTTGNPFHAGRTVSRFCRISGRRHAPGTGGLPERDAHQRSVRRHRQLGLDPDRLRSGRSPS